MPSRPVEEWPEDSPQFGCASWWDESEGTRPVRGSLLWAFLPHVDQQAYVLVSEGRTSPTAHETADYSVAPLDVRNPPQAARLPVAGLPHYGGEVRVVQRAKRRPAVVISTGGDDVPKALRTGAARYQTNASLLVAPYYGADRRRTSGGWKPQFVERIRRITYPQYMWDRLPLPGSQESILRLDHMQPLGRHQSNYDLTGYRLSEDALLLLDEWIEWLIRGDLEEDGILLGIRSELADG